MKNGAVKYILIIILSGVLLNAAGFVLFGTLAGWQEKSFINSDAAVYYLLAKNILSGHGFSLSEAAPYLPSRFRTPGYPLFVAALLAVFNSVFAVLVFQNILSVAAAVFLFLILRELFKKDVPAAILAVLFLLDPLLAHYQNTLMTYSLVVFFLALITWLFLRYLSSGRLATMAVFAFSLGAAALVKPIFQYLAVIFAVAALYRGKKQGRLREAAAAAVLLFAVIFVTVSPWLVRNKIQFGDTHFSSIDWANIYYVNAAMTLAVAEGRNWTVVMGEMMSGRGEPLQYSRGMEYAGFAVSSELVGRAVKIFLAHPGAVFKMSVVGAARFFLDEGGADLGYALSPNSLTTVGLGNLLSRGEFGRAIFELFHRRPVILIPMIFFKLLWLVFWFFIIYGFRHLRKETDLRQKIMVVLSAAAILYFTLLTLPNTEARNRILALMFFYILIGYGVSKWRWFAKKEP